WNGGLETIGDIRRSLSALDAACLAIGRDPKAIGRSAEILVRALPRPAGESAEPMELAGTPAAIGAAIAAYAELGIDELQVQLRPNTRAAVDAFAKVIATLS
ncbi:MAG: hypothetical protein QOF49_388, partial [Chloroflexota bacterium]|nr:hypothetical protein [Chloroflexota bacterium]